MFVFLLIFVSQPVRELRTTLTHLGSCAERDGEGKKISCDELLIPTPERTTQINTVWHYNECNGAIEEGSIASESW